MIKPIAMRSGSRRLAATVLCCGLWIGMAPLVLAAAPAATGTASTEVDTSAPDKLISSAATAMLSDLDSHRAEYTKDPKKIEALVDRVLLPHFDSDYAAQLVLGRHWATASVEQRRRFVDGFYHSLLRNYSSALAGFTGEQLKVLPYRGDASAPSATVRTQVRKSDGGTVAVNYSLRRGEQGWKAWDVVIEGISYVKSFRDDFGAEVDRNGLDALIAKLESGAVPSAVKQPAADKK
jgi:phospholipid transport system substrate-binding protein